MISDIADDSSVQYPNKCTNRQVFSMAEEAELEKYIKNSSDINYGFTYVQILELAHQNITELTNQAYLRAFTANNIIMALRNLKFGLAFSDEDFSSSYVTDRPMDRSFTVAKQGREEIGQDNGKSEDIAFKPLQEKTVPPIITLQLSHYPSGNLPLMLAFFEWGAISHL
ncbi:hypothetical protein ILUMI_03717 [Ignelater luminosus]|uniref:Uncharacterized protein n=1 Tax=Ignelater luminosus TaxID=2038154 RepID=A0A8K0DDZ4_IGNLU|nr:hypothetical protein ILUMI_03717 [Ignelater luminosus]